ncbi:ATP-binding protein [Sphingomonas aurantiaca]|uniref:ATP-binding protein n=1 Tax=Sphingomonas aurantiaca TaxID=185949 RepID=UPI003360B0E9
MNTPILLPDRIRTSISLGESHFREFKSALEGIPGQKTPRDKKSIADDICRTLVGFANADGGELLVGVEDDGIISGLENISPKNIEYLEKCWKDGIHKDTPLVNVRVNRLELETHWILHFVVPKLSDRICLTSDGRCLQRKDLETVPVHFQEIQFSRQEQASRVYDREYVDNASIDDLDIQAVKVLADKVSAGMSAEKCLQYLGLADFNFNGLQLTRAAVLLFANEIWKWHPRSHVRILKVSGTELKTGESYNIASDDPIQGNILFLIQETWDRLRPHLTQTKLGKTGKFEARVTYPEGACREALINALAHRDYSQEGRGIEIYVFDNRIEIKNPGSLLASLSLNEIIKLDGAHQSRNTLVARCLREIGYMREVGEGIRRMFDIMRDNELELPKLSSEASTFSVVLSNSLMYSREHIIWLENFNDLDLSKSEKAIVVLGYDARILSANDIIKDLNLVDIEDYRKLVESLSKKGILSATMDRNAAYRFAERKKVSRRDVARYQITLPGEQKFPKKAEAAEKPSPKKVKDIQDMRVFIGNIPRGTEQHVITEIVNGAAKDYDIEWPIITSSIGPIYCVVHIKGKQYAEKLSKHVGMKLIDNSKLLARTAEGNGKNTS